MQLNLLKTCVFCFSFPNVGKSSFMNKVIIKFSINNVFKRKGQ